MQKHTPTSYVLSKKELIPNWNQLNVALVYSVARSIKPLKINDLINGGGGGNLIVCPILRYSTIIFSSYYDIHRIDTPKMLDVIRPHWTIVNFIGHDPEIVSIVNFTCKSGGDDLSTELLYSGCILRSTYPAGKGGQRNCQPELMRLLGTVFLLRLLC